MPDPDSPLRALPVPPSLVRAAGLAVVVFVALIAAGGASASAATTTTTADDDADPAPATIVTSAADLDAYLLGKGSPMAGQGAAFVASGGAWQIDPRLLVAIAGAESSFGRITCAPFNAWGWGCPNGPYNFDSWADGIDTVAQGLRENYLAEGRTSVAAIHAKYAPIGAANDPTGLNNAWTANVSKFLQEMGGDPLNVDLSGVGGTMFLGLPLDGGLAAGAFGAGESKVDTGDAIAAGDRPATISIRVENTGFVDWTPEDVRLRRVDDDRAVGSAPYAALAEAGVEPGGAGSFELDLVAAPGAIGARDLTFRLEGPGGSFGEPVRVSLDVTAGPYRYAVESVEATDGRYIVRLTNAGTVTWDRDDDPVELVVGATAIPMLEREAVPGESATFVFSEPGRMSVGHGDEPVPGPPIVIE